MGPSHNVVDAGVEDARWREAERWAGAFLAGYANAATRRAYRGDLRSWFAYCALHGIHPYDGIRRTHVELYLRELEDAQPPLAHATLYRRIATLSAWYRWLEDEEVQIGNPAARVRRPPRHSTPQPWLNRNELTDVLARAEDEGGAAYALICLLALNGLRVSEACTANLDDVAGTRYQPTLRIVGKGDKPADIVLNPRTHQAIAAATTDRRHGPLLLNRAGRRMQPHNAAGIVRRAARAAGIDRRVTPHALRRSYITVGLLQGVSLRDMQRAARHSKADTTVAYDQSERSFHRDPTFVLMAATAR